MRKANIVVLSLLAFGLVTLQSGCGGGSEETPKTAQEGGKKEAKTEVKKGPGLPQGLSSWQDELVKGKKEIDAVLASLDALVAAPASDLRSKYDAFVKAIGVLEAQAAQVRSRRQAVEAQGNAYFTAWEEKLKKIGTADIAKIAEARRNELKAEYTAIQEILKNGKAVYDQFLSDLKDIKKILDNDLNVNGVKAMGPSVEKLKKDAKVLEDHIDKLLGSLNKIAAIYSPGAK